MRWRNRLSADGTAVFVHSPSGVLGQVYREPDAPGVEYVALLRHREPRGFQSLRAAIRYVVASKVRP